MGNSVFEWEIMIMLDEEQDILYGGAYRGTGACIAGVSLLESMTDELQEASSAPASLSLPPTHTSLPP